MIIATAPTMIAHTPGRARFLGLGSTLAFHDTDPDIVRDRRGAGGHEADDDRRDGYECNRGDAGQKEIAKRRVCPTADELRQQRTCHVAALVKAGDGRRAHVHSCAVANDQRQQVKTADDDHRP